MIKHVRARLAVLGITSAIAAWPAFAQAQEGSLYVGGSFGQAETNDFCAAMRDVAASFPGTSVTSCDEKDSAWKLFGGYQFNRNFALEASYFDYGNASASFSVLGTPLGINGDASAFGIAAVGILPLANQFSLFGKVGLLRTEVEISGSGGAFADTDSDSETGLHFGVGVMFNLGRFSIRAEWERNDEAEIDMISLGAQIRF